jgi:ribonuclease T1
MTQASLAAKRASQTVSSCLYIIQRLRYRTLINPYAFMQHCHRGKFLVQALFIMLALLFSLTGFARSSFDSGVVPVSELPREARATLQLIKQGGPFPYDKDGIVFGNYERLLPKQKRGYYREFTVKTPGARNRGARRIVAGGESGASREYFYTDDHYASFRRIQE